MTDTSIASKEAPAKAASARRVLESVRCFGHGLSIYFWPLFFVPLLMEGLVDINVVDGKTAVWCIAAAYLVVASAIGFDMSRLASVAFGAVLGLLIVSVWALQLQFQLPLFGYFGNWLRSIPVGFTAEVKSFIYILAAIFAFLWLWEIGDAWADGRWHFSKMEFEHFSFGRKDAGYRATEYTLTTSTPDMLKYVLLFGGGRIEIVNSQDRLVQATVNHVFRGSRKGRQIRAMLQSIQVVQVAH